MKNMVAFIAVAIGVMFQTSGMLCPEEKKRNYRTVSIYLSLYNYVEIARYISRGAGRNDFMLLSHAESFFRQRSFCKNSLLTLYYLNSEKDWETWRKPIVLVEDFNKDLLEGPIPPRCASPVPGKSTFFLMLEK